MKIKKDEEIKVRVDASTKAAFWNHAATQQLDMSDVVRQALREFLLRNTQIQQQRAA